MTYMVTMDKLCTPVWLKSQICIFKTRVCRSCTERI